jgi:uncharacterized membrane protein YphA (DoxX/SURF4 family)
VELAAGILMMLGPLTRSAAAAAGALLLMAAFILRTHEFDWTKGGYEYAVLWGLTCLLVLARASGCRSVQHTKLNGVS